MIRTERTVVQTGLTTCVCRLIRDFAHLQQSHFYTRDYNDHKYYFMIYFLSHWGIRRMQNI